MGFTAVRFTAVFCLKQQIREIEFTKNIFYMKNINTNDKIANIDLKSMQHLMNLVK